MVINVLDSTSREGEKFVICEMNINDIYDLVNGMLVLIARKEEDYVKYGKDEKDKKQLERYKEVLKGLQDIKGKIK